MLNTENRLSFSVMNSLEHYRLSSCRDCTACLFSEKLGCVFPLFSRFSSNANFPVKKWIKCEIDGYSLAFYHYPIFPSRAERRVMRLKIFSALYQGEGSESSFQMPVAEVRVTHWLDRKKQIMDIPMLEAVSYEVIYFGTVSGCDFSSRHGNINSFLR